jgi:hypothetical protein
MDSSRRQPEQDPRAAMRRLAQGADRICRLILDAELPDVDVDIAINNLRDEADELLPGSGDLFDRIYESRFRRLREQFPRGVPG